MSAWQLINQLKAVGFSYSSDTMGTYFNRGNYRFSIVPHGPGYCTYLNELQVQGWKLLKKGDFTIDYIEALTWVANQGALL